jgi:hypothetical protein
MIINGGARNGVGYWSNHLLNDEKNDRAEVVEIDGLLATDLPTALREMKAIAGQSRCKGDFMYCANINPRDYEHLTAEQWREAVATLEKDLGLEGHQRVVVEHEKDGRTHRHIIWNRVDVETLRVADIGFNFYTHEQTARALEIRFGLDRTPSLHGQRREDGRPERAPELSEKRAAERSGIDPKAIKAELTELWHSTDSGKAFAAAIEERGYILAKGDRRDFCIVDQAGDAHSLARRLDGVKAQDVRGRMADIDRDSLPSVAEAREQQRNRPPPDRQSEPMQATPAQPQPEEQAERPIEAIHQDHARAEQEHARATAIRQLEAAARADAQKLRDPESVQRRFGDAAREGAQHVHQETREAKQTERQEAWKEYRDDQVARVAKERPVDHAKAAVKGGLRVADAATGVATGLADFVSNLFAGSSQPPPSPAQVSQAEQIKERRRAHAALERIADSIEQGKDLKSEDVKSLTPQHLENIRLRGDDYMRNLIEGLEYDRGRERDYGRTRER